MAAFTDLTKVTVIGAGAWGTALAIHCARKGHDTLLWAMEKDAVEEINTKHTNETFLKASISMTRMAVVLPETTA